MALEVTLAVQHELQSRRDEADSLRHQQVERAKYEADLARARFMKVDPRNRLVADSLEAEWNEKLRELANAQELYERHRQQDAIVADDSTRSEVLTLATNFPKLWNDSRTSDRDRKRILRLLVDDVTLIHSGEITAHVRFQGGIIETLTLPRPLNSWELRQTSPQIIQAIDQLLNEFTEGQIADQFNHQGLRSGMGSPFCGRLVAQIRRAYRIQSRYDRLRARGLLTQSEVAQELGIHPSTVRKWMQSGIVTAHVYNDKNERLYELSPDNRPIKQQGIKFSDARRIHHIAPERTKEV
jgi:hypothetical protein